MADISDKLKDLTKEFLTEESLNEIETAFDAAVEEKSTLRVEKALTEQDEDHAEKVQTLLEAIDADHTTKLERLVEAIDSTHSEKLKNIIAKYEHTLTEEANELRGDLIGNISGYLDVYLEKAVPVESIKEAVDNKRADELISELRKVLAVDMAVAKDSIKGAIVDGKKRIDEATSQAETVVSENTQLKEELDKTKAQLILEQKTVGMEDAKKRHLMKILNNKSSDFITENFDYTSNLFDKTEDEKLDELKAQATSHIEPVADRPEEVIQESVQEEQPDVAGEWNVPFRTSYMDELQKW